jgi:hypothetical protein
MAEQTLSSLAMLPEFFAAEPIEASARQTGFVKRVAKITGKLFLALVTFGVWSDATTPLAQWAAKATQWDEQVALAPEAIYQRMTKSALAFLQDMLRPALAQVHSLEKGWDDGLFPGFPKVDLADSTGVALPDSLHTLFPGSGGSAGKAGAKIQAVWDYKNRVFAHFALPPWNIPEQTSIDTVGACAKKGALFLFDLGYFKIKAFARLAADGAYFLSRLNHQTTILPMATARWQPLALASGLMPVPDPCSETPLGLGAQERVPCRLVASRVPASLVHERGRLAKKKAKKKGATPSKAHLTL